MDQLNRRLLAVTGGAVVILAAVAFTQSGTNTAAGANSAVIPPSVLTNVASAPVTGGEIVHPRGAQSIKAGQFTLQNDDAQKQSIVTVKLQPDDGDTLSVSARTDLTDSDVKQTQLVTVTNNEDGTVSDVFTEGTAHLRRSANGQFNGLTLELGPGGSERVDVSLGASNK